MIFCIIFWKDESKSSNKKINWFLMIVGKSFYSLQIASNVILFHFELKREIKPIHRS